MKADYVKNNMDMDAAVRMVADMQRRRDLAFEEKVTRAQVAETAVELYRDKLSRKVRSAVWTAVTFLAGCCAIAGLWFAVETILKGV